MKNLLWLWCKFDLDQSEGKSSQVNASARKAWPNRVTSRPNFSTCVYLLVCFRFSLKVKTFIIKLNKITSPLSRNYLSRARDIWVKLRRSLLLLSTKNLSQFHASFHIDSKFPITFQQLDLSRSSRECCQQPKYFVNNHATLTIENFREGSSVIRQLVALVFVEFKVSCCAATNITRDG